jgi:hypothetical protein
MLNNHIDSTPGTPTSLGKVACKEETMIEDVVVEPMAEEFLLWRCLHGGPLSRNTIARQAAFESGRRLW